MFFAHSGSNPVEQATTAGAVAMVVSPLWLHAIETGHAILDDAYLTAQFLLPFAGLAWIAMQMFYKYKGKDHE